MRSLSEINYLNSRARAGKGRPTLDIENVDQTAVENYIRDLALLTMTNAEDWNFRFVAARNPFAPNLVWFTHAAQAPHSVPVVAFHDVLQLVRVYLQKKEEERGSAY